MSCLCATPISASLLARSSIFPSSSLARPSICFAASSEKQRGAKRPPPFRYRNQSKICFRGISLYECLVYSSLSLIHHEYDSPFASIHLSLHLLFFFLLSKPLLTEKIRPLPPRLKKPNAYSVLLLPLDEAKHGVHVLPGLVGTAERVKNTR